MKVLKDEDENFIIYLTMMKIKCDMDHKEDIIRFIKDSILKINKVYRLNLKGFYKVRVYIHSKVGAIIEIINIDDISINNAIDLRVLVYFDQDFYIEVDDFDFLPIHKKIIYLNEKYYINVDNLTKNEIIRLLDLGTIIYKTENIENFHLGKIIIN